MSEAELSETEQKLQYEKKHHDLFQFLIIFSWYEDQSACIKEHT